MALHEPQNTSSRPVFDAWARPGHNIDLLAAIELRAPTQGEAAGPSLHTQKLERVERWPSTPLAKVAHAANALSLWFVPI